MLNYRGFVVYGFLLVPAESVNQVSTTTMFCPQIQETCLIREPSAAFRQLFGRSWIL